MDKNIRLMSLRDKLNQEADTAKKAAEKAKTKKSIPETKLGRKNKDKKNG